MGRAHALYRLACRLSAQARSALPWLLLGPPWHVLGFPVMFGLLGRDVNCLPLLSGLEVLNRRIPTPPQCQSPPARRRGFWPLIEGYLPQHLIDRLGQVQARVDDGGRSVGVRAALVAPIRFRVVGVLGLAMATGGLPIGLEGIAGKRLRFGNAIGAKHRN